MNESLIKEETDAKTLTLEKYYKSNLIYSSRYSFCKSYDIKKFDKLSFKWNNSHLVDFFYFKEIGRHKTPRKNLKKKKANMYNTAS